jgi:hypothetical protein
MNETRSKLNPGKEFNFTATENKKNTVLSGFHPSPRKEI